jgi:hypothetical protein
MGGYLYDQNHQLVSYTGMTAALSSTANKVLLKFNGQQIWDSMGGVFHLTLDIHNSDGTPAVRFEDVYTTASYETTQFSPAAASLKDTCTDHGGDDNQDTLYEYLDINVGLNVSVAGIYTVTGSLFDAGGNGLGNAVCSGQLAIGDRILTLRFPGKEIYKNAVNGPYRLDNLKLMNSGGTLLGRLDPGYLTSGYDYHSFSSLINLTGTYTDYGSDTDNDGTFEYLTFEVGVMLSNPGYCVASARLVDKKGIEIDTASSTTQCAAGTPQTVKINFDGPAISNHAVNGPYQVKDVYVYHTGDPAMPDFDYTLYTTAYFDYIQFGSMPPLARDDEYGVLLNTALVIGQPGLLANDYNSYRKAMTAIKFTEPEHGDLVLSADGSFTYTPDAAYTGSDSFTYKVNDGYTDSAAGTVVLTVETFTIVSNSRLPAGEVKLNYPEITLKAMGGDVNSSYLWTIPKVPKGNALPSGIKLTVSKKDSSIAVLSGKPAKDQTVSFNIQITDKKNSKKVKTRTFTMTVYKAMTAKLPVTPNLEAGIALKIWTPQVSNGLGPYKWTVTPQLPPGLDLDIATGDISGIPTTAGTYKFDLKVTDAIGAMIIFKYVTFNVLKPVTITDPKPKAGKAGTSYSLALKATGGKTPFAWSIDSGTLPVWAAFNTKTGAITVKKGSKTVAGTWKFSVKVTDFLGAWDTQEVTIIIN